MLILQTIRASTTADRAVRQEKWRDNLKGTPDTRGLVVGIIGMGNIGKVGVLEKFAHSIDERE